MTIPSLHRAARRMSLVAGLSAALVGVPLAASAQDLAATQAPDVELPAGPDLGKGLGKGLPKGALVFHGNYCGPGSRGAGLPPVDALDRACMHHDACSPPVGQGLPSCACNDQLEREASLIAHTPRIRDDLRTTAEFVAVGAKVMACEP
ncbi:hypothetical protein BGCPKDLD_0256 [Methylorubrum suomiense]|uniref:Phospholipase A2 domain-containing protein n=2 Tax=Methylobacteriaceae TaxID=119045 RepID=A0ABQ4UPX4_9HYPH|nr:hypothetical protein BGCPKDLD_0256 [Methylorubrum suomiense]